MGIHNLFGNANFSDVFESSEQKFQTELVHKAKIEIDESGSTAAAATALRAFVSAREEFIFNCNHPFMFVIHNQQFHEILFAGIYRGNSN